MGAKYFSRNSSSEGSTDLHSYLFTGSNATWYLLDERAGGELILNWPWVLSNSDEKFQVANVPSVLSEHIFHS